MNEAELLATLQVVFVLLCGVSVFSVICTVVVVVREYRHTRIVRHAAKHSRGPEVPVSNMVVLKSTVEGAIGGVKYTPSAPQSPAVKEDALNTLQDAGFTPEEPKQTWSQPTGYLRAPRKRHARHGR